MHPLPVMFVAVVIAIIVLFGWAIADLQGVFVPEATAGECYIDKDDKERWDERYIIRIEEVGIRNYRIRYWRDRAWGSDWTQPKRWLRFYDKTTCPDKPKENA